MIVQTVEKIREIVDKWSEIDLSSWYHNGYEGFIIIQSDKNPQEKNIWNVIDELKNVDNITMFEVELAEDINDYDELRIDFIETKR